MHDIIKSKIEILSNIEKLRKVKEIRKAQENLVLLLDCSGSMREVVGEKRKIDHLREAILHFPTAKVYGFNSGFFPIETVPEPNGLTAMRGAFINLASYLNTNTNLILISDGLPTDADEEEVIQTAKTLPCPVNVLFIGTENDGENFMKRLASETGGKEITINPQELDINLNLALTEGIKRLALPKRK